MADSASEVDLESDTSSVDGNLLFPGKFMKESYSLFYMRNASLICPLYRRVSPILVKFIYVRFSVEEMLL